MDFAGSAEMSADQKNASGASMDLAALGDIVGRFAGKKIILFGDFVADEFQFGEISRVSREAPVLILRHRGTNVAPGGGANAANNLAALGAKVVDSWRKIGSERAIGTGRRDVDVVRDPVFVM